MVMQKFRRATQKFKAQSATTYHLNSNEELPRSTSLVDTKIYV